MSKVKVVYNENKETYDVETDLVFDDEHHYVVGYDTCGKGVVFDDLTYACYDEDDFVSEVIRVVDSYILDMEVDLNNNNPEECLTLQETLVVAQLLSIDCESETIS